jgi:hypothetical protein
MVGGMAERTRTDDDGGQASVELVALLPLILGIGLLLVQGVVVGWAEWSAGGAARAAARAHAVGAAPLPAARGAVAGGLRGATSVVTRSDHVRVRVRVPTLVPGVSLGSVESRSWFTPQDGGS